MRYPKYELNENVIFYCKYKNEKVIGEITNIREAKYNWDYSIKYHTYFDLTYAQWVNEQDILEKIKK